VSVMVKMSHADSDISNAEVLDKFKEAFGFRTDREVSDFLGVDKMTVCQIRQEAMGLSIAQRLKILGRLASVQIRDLHEKIEPDNLCGAMLEKFPGLKAGMSKSQEINVKLLELFKSYGQEQKLFRIDREMSDFLGLKRATISSVRIGRSKFGPLPRLLMLKAINPGADIDQVLNGLESKQCLIELIEKHIEIRSKISL
jgi:hypothetical protein